MSTQGDGDGLVEVFVKGAVLALGAAAAGLVIRRVFGREPEVVVVAVAADELRRVAGGSGGRRRGRGRGGERVEHDDAGRDAELDDAGQDELEVDLDALDDEDDA